MTNEQIERKLKELEERSIKIERLLLSLHGYFSSHSGDMILVSDLFTRLIENESSLIDRVQNLHDRGPGGNKAYLEVLEKQTELFRHVTKLYNIAGKEPKGKHIKKANKEEIPVQKLIQ